MHVHQLQSQICKPRKPPALREVKHPHKGRTSVSRFPLAKQGISSQYSGCFEGIGHFTRDPCKFHLKSDLQSGRHASEEVNTEKMNTHWVHSYKMEHEDGNTQHRFLFQLNSSSSMNMIAYDHRQNRGKSNRPKNSSGKEREQNKKRVQTSSSTAQLSRKPPGMEGKCMRCGKPEHQQGEKCAAKNKKCKECHKIGHFYKVCQSSKKTRRARRQEEPI